MQKKTVRKYQTSLFRRYVCLAFIIVFGYLSEVCIMPYLTVFGVTPNLLYVMIGIVTVAYGKLRAFWVGLVYGILMLSLSAMQKEASFGLLVLILGLIMDGK